MASTNPRKPLMGTQQEATPIAAYKVSQFQAQLSPAGLMCLEQEAAPLAAYKVLQFQAQLSPAGLVCTQQEAAPLAAYKVFQCRPGSATASSYSQQA